MFLQVFVLHACLSSTILYNIRTESSQIYLRNEAIATEGKVQYDMILNESKMPRYGQCWKKAVKLLHYGCKDLTDDVQSRLAIHFTNCHMEKSGRQTFDCSVDNSIEDCTGKMNDLAFTTYTNFFTHTHNICYFLQSQVWHETTEDTIVKLADNSADVAVKLQESSDLQQNIIEQQNNSRFLTAELLTNQRILLDNGVALRDVINGSSVNIQKIFAEFKNSTSEHKMMLIEVFETVTNLHRIVVGEVTGFYSLIFYSLSILISYVITSTPRTTSARFWLFLIMSLNFLFERYVCPLESPISVHGYPLIGYVLDFGHVWLCRQIFCSLAILVLLVSICRYKDYNRLNNKLLVDIKDQNDQLKRMLSSPDFNRSFSNGAVASSSLVKALAAPGSPPPPGGEYLSDDDDVSTSSRRSSSYTGSGTISHVSRQSSNELEDGEGEDDEDMNRRFRGSFFSDDEDDCGADGETDSGNITDSESSATDDTYRPGGIGDSDNGADSDGSVTSNASTWSHASSSAQSASRTMREELEDLLRATPNREMLHLANEQSMNRPSTSAQVSAAGSTAPTSSAAVARLTFASPSKERSSCGHHSYGLRNIQVPNYLTRYAAIAGGGESPSRSSPSSSRAVPVSSSSSHVLPLNESPRDFARLVNRMAQISQRNTTRTKAKVLRRAAAGAAEGGDEDLATPH